MGPLRDVSGPPPERKGEGPKEPKKPKEPKGKKPKEPKGPKPTGPKGPKPKKPKGKKPKGDRPDPCFTGVCEAGFVDVTGGYAVALGEERPNPIRKALKYEGECQHPRGRDVDDDGFIRGYYDGRDYDEETGENTFDERSCKVCRRRPDRCPPVVEPLRAQSAFGVEDIEGF